MGQRPLFSPRNKVFQREIGLGHHNYRLRCRILDRIRRFLRPILRRPFPVFFVPTVFSGNSMVWPRWAQRNDKFNASGPCVARPARDFCGNENRTKKADSSRP